MTEAEIQETTARLKRGEVVVFPTDTVFGVGCIYSNKEAINRVYRIKGRPLSQPTHLLVSNRKMAAKLGYINNPLAQAFIHNFWPGPITLVVPAKVVNIPHLFITGPERMVGIRMPNHPELLQIIEAVGEPILGPSANKAGKEPPVTRNQVDKEISVLVDYIVGERAGAQSASTVVELTRENYRVIRAGPITDAMINRAIGPQRK